MGAVDWSGRRIGERVCFDLTCHKADEGEDVPLAKSPKPNVKFLPMWSEIYLGMSFWRTLFRSSRPAFKLWTKSGLSASWALKAICYRRNGASFCAARRPARIPWARPKADAVGYAYLSPSMVSQPASETLSSVCPSTQTLHANHRDATTFDKPQALIEQLSRLIFRHHKQERHEALCEIGMG